MLHRHVGSSQFGSRWWGPPEAIRSISVGLASLALKTPLGVGCERRVRDGACASAALRSTELSRAPGGDAPRTDTASFSRCRLILVRTMSGSEDTQAQMLAAISRLTAVVEKPSLQIDRLDAVQESTAKHQVDVVAQLKASQERLGARLANTAGGRPPPLFAAAGCRLRLAALRRTGPPCRRMPVRAPSWSASISMSAMALRALARRSSDDRRSAHPSAGRRATSLAELAAVSVAAFPLQYWRGSPRESATTTPLVGVERQLPPEVPMGPFQKTGRRPRRAWRGSRQHRLAIHGDGPRRGGRGRSPDDRLELRALRHLHPGAMAGHSAPSAPLRTMAQEPRARTRSSGARRHP